MQILGTEVRNGGTEGKLFFLFRGYIQFDSVCRLLLFLVHDLSVYLRGLYIGVS